MSVSFIMSITQIARLCHEANKAYCHSLGDMSQPPWEEAPAWQKESAIAGVRAVLLNPEAPASASHDSWLAHKEADGWVYGEVKNPDATPPTHPCMVPYDELPAAQKGKDMLFQAIVLACRVI